MVTCTDGDALLVEQLSYLGGRDAWYVERDDADAVLRIADDGDARYACYLLACILGELMLVALYVVDAYGVDKVEGVTQSDGVGYVGRACLEACWRRIELGLLNGDILNHIAATLPRG